MVDCLESLILSGSSDIIHLFEILTARTLDWNTHSLAPKTARVRIEKGGPVLSAPLVRSTGCHHRSSRAASDPRSLVKKFHYALLLPGS